jgi:hypothetical protein
MTDIVELRKASLADQSGNGFDLWPSPARMT